MQTDATGLLQQIQKIKDIQANISREQEMRADTSDDHAVERQLLVDLPQTSGSHSLHHQEVPSTSTNNISVSNSINQSYSTAMTSFDMSTDFNKLPPTEYDLLCEAVKTNPYNSASWNALIEHSERSKDIIKIRSTYDWILDIFPNTPPVQIAYLKHFTEHLDKDSQEAAQGLFKKFLPQSASPELFRFYLQYVRKINSGRTNFQGTMQKSFEFALTACGHDKDAGMIWSDYVAFVKSWDVKSAPDAYAKQRNELRKIYRRAVAIPLESLEQLWKDYNEFENQDKQEGRKQLAPVVPMYTTAKTVLRELRELMKVIYPANPPPAGTNPLVHDIPTPPVFSKQERGLRDNWVKYLLWEQKNPLDLELNSEIGKREYINRMKGVYRRAVVKMRYYSEIWFWFYTWNAGLEQKERVVPDPSDILKEGIRANPLSCMLNFALTELYEREGQKEDAETVLRNLLEKSYEDLLKVESKLPAEGTQNDEEASPENVPPTTTTNNGAAQPNSSEKKKDIISNLLRLRIREVGQAWINFLRFAWRSKGFQEMRNVFREARADEKRYPSRFLDWRVWDFAARTEYHRGRDSQVAVKIYETGLKKMGKDVEVEYVIHYLKFLINTNDINNARALFERTISNYSGLGARELWGVWWKFEYYFSDVEQSKALDKRLAEAYPEDLATRRLGLRHSYEFDAIATKDRGSITPENSAAQLAVRGETTLETNGTSTPSAQAAVPNTVQPPPTIPPRRPSLDRKRRDDSPRRHDAPPHKRQRPLSPPPPPRERYDLLPRRRGSPGWERERDRSRDRDRERDRERERERERDDAPSRRFEREREENRDRPPASSVPSLINWFTSTLPRASQFDGPVFRTDDLMSVLRNATIPINPPGRSRSPPPYRGRPPPDYGPYRGPNSVPPRRY